VTDRDVHDVKLLKRDFTSPVSVDFVWDGDPPAQLPPPSGIVLLQTARMNHELSFGFVASGASEAVPLQPDEYTIDVHWINPGWYVKDIMCGGRSTLHGAALLGGAESCGSLRIVLAHDGGSLALRVADRDGNPIPDAYVAIIPESAASTEAEMSAAMTFGQTAANGVYSATSLQPGKYRILATNETIDLASNRVDKLWLAQSRAQEVEIGPNANVQLKLEPQPLR